MVKTSIREARKPGSTIDDSARLEKIAHAVLATPDLSLTQIIKSIGITDRASVRRLRDKYNRSLKGAPPKAVKAAAATSRQAAMALRATGTGKTKRSPTPPKSAKLSKKSTRQSDRAGDANTDARSQTQPQPATPTQETKPRTTNGIATYGMMMPPWFSIGLDLSAVAMHTQVQFYEQMMRTGPLSNMVKQQSEMIKAVTGFYNFSASSSAGGTKRKAA